MKKQQLEIILSSGNENQIKAVHFAAAKIFLTQNPQAFLTNLTNIKEEASLYKLITCFKEKFPELSLDKLNGSIRILIDIKQNIINSPLNKPITSAIDEIDGSGYLSEVINLIESNSEEYKLASYVFRTKR